MFFFRGNALRVGLLAVLLSICACAFGQLEAGAAWPKFQHDLADSGEGVMESLAYGGVRWTYAGGAGFKSPAVVNASNVVYASDTSGDVYAWDGLEGTLLWSANLPAGTVVSPLIDSAHDVIFCDEGGNVSAYNETSGILDWRYTIPSNESIVYSPTIDSNGTLYFASSDNNLYALDTKTQTQLWTYSVNTSSIGSIATRPDGSLCFSDLDSNIIVLDPATQSLVWSHAEAESSTAGAMPVSLADGSILVSVASDMEVIPSSGIGISWLIENDETGITSPNFNDYWYVSTNSNSGVQGFRHSGIVDQTWTYSSGGVTEASSICDQFGAVFFGADDGYLYCVTGNDNTSQLAWKTSLGAPVQASPVMGADGAIFVGCSDGTFCAMDSNELANFYEAPDTVVGGHSTYGVVQLAGKADSSGVAVNFTSPNPKVQVPASVTIPNEKAGASFLITTSPVSTQQFVDVEGTWGDISIIDAELTVNPAPISNLYASSSTVVGGHGTTGVVQIGGPTGTGGDVISLHSSSANLVVPASVTVPSGKTGASFSITSSQVSASESDTVTATLTPTTGQMTIVVNPAPLSNFYAGTGTITGGSTDSLVVQLQAAAVGSGDAVSISSGNASLVVPASVTVPAGKTGVSFQATSTAVSTVTPVTVTATLGSSVKTATITLNPHTISNFYTSPSSVTGGALTYGVVQLSGPAGPSGNVIALQSGNSNVTVPATVTVPAGKTGVSFQIRTKAVTSSASVTLTATETLAAGPQNVTTGLTLNP